MARKMEPCRELKRVNDLFCCPNRRLEIKLFGILSLGAELAKPKV
jgi:hypothetical protein